MQGDERAGLHMRESRNYATMILLALAKDKTGGTEVAATLNIDFILVTFRCSPRERGLGGKWTLQNAIDFVLCLVFLDEKIGQLL